VPIVIRLPFDDDILLDVQGTGPDGRLTMLDATGTVQGLATSLFDPETKHNVPLAVGFDSIHRFSSLDAIPLVLQVDLRATDDSGPDFAMVGVIYIVVSTAY
tara:strand:+ start:8983 stop:9288 length:306 start_codon:yes stop_codon:yes gene_type:complete